MASQCPKTCKATKASIQNTPPQVSGDMKLGPDFLVAGPMLPQVWPRPGLKPPNPTPHQGLSQQDTACEIGPSLLLALCSFLPAHLSPGCRRDSHHVSSVRGAAGRHELCPHSLMQDAQASPCVG